MLGSGAPSDAAARSLAAAVRGRHHSRPGLRQQLRQPRHGDPQQAGEWGALQFLSDKVCSFFIGVTVSGVSSIEAAATSGGAGGG